MQRIGLTGGIGSGKSTVARLFSRYEIAIVDADAISRQLTAPQGAAVPAIANQFGAAVMCADGGLNRDAVRALVLQDIAARRCLEAIIHPLVAQETARLTDEARNNSYRIIVYDIPLLVESGHWRSALDAVVVVDCQNATQIDRVMARESGRSGWTVQAVQHVIAAQASRTDRLAAADICIYNDGISLSALVKIADETVNQFGL